MQIIQVSYFLKGILLFCEICICNFNYFQFFYIVTLFNKTSV